MQRYIFAITFLDLLGASLVVPLLSHHARTLGATNTQVGLLQSMYGALQLFGSPLFGRLSDSFGRRDVLMIAMLCTASSYFMSGLSSSVWMLMLARIPVGLGKQSLSLCQSVITDSTTKEERFEALSFNNAAIAAGFVFGPAAGGYLQQVGGFRLPCWIASSLFCFNAYLAWKHVPTHKRAVEIQEVSAKSNAKRGPMQGKTVEPVLSQRSTWRVLIQLPVSVLLVLALRLTTSMNNQLYRSTFSSVTMSVFKTSPQVNGYVLSYTGFLGFLTQQVVAPWIKSRLKSDCKLLIICSLCSALALFSLSLPTSLIAFAVVLAPLTIANNAVRTGTISTLSQFAPADAVGTTMGLSGSIDSVCRIIAPVAGAATLDKFGHQYVYTVCGIFSLLASLMAYKISKYSMGETVTDTKKSK